MLYALLVGLHILVSIILIMVVLLQTGKSADLAGAFGGGGSQTAFGSRGAATFLSKMTTSSAVLFMITSFSLAVYSARGTTSVLDVTGVNDQQEAAAPTTAPLAVLPIADDGDSGAVVTDDEGRDTAAADSGLAPTGPDAEKDGTAVLGESDPATPPDTN